MRAIVTRARTQADELAEAVRAAGHEPVLCPLIEIEPLGDDPVELGGYDWVVVTSVNGARELLRRAVGAWPSVAAIGPGTADALARAGVEPALVPPVSTQEGLLDAFPQPTGRVLVAAAEGARRLLVHALGADFVALYRTIEVIPAEAPAGDVVILASASAARAWGGLGADLPAVSIGPQTTKAAAESGIRVVAEARTHDLAGLVAALEEAAR